MRATSLVLLVLCLACGAGISVESPDAGPCAAGQLSCGGQCVSAQDPAHCGACGNACAAADSCVDGACAHVDCRQAGTHCATGTYCSLNDGRCLPGCASDSQCAEGSETCDLSTHACTCVSGRHRCGSACVFEDQSSCGQSCTACEAPNGGAVSCVLHQCQAGCGAGSHLCGNSCTLNLNPATCGSSCAPCTAPAHGVATCDGSACGFTCEAGFSKCGSACVDTRTDAQNCGACGTACGFSQVCARSACRTTCTGTPGFASPTFLPAAGTLYPLAVDDFTGSGNGDLALADGGTVYIAAGRGDGGFAAPALRTSFSRLPAAVATGDVDQNGLADLVGLGNSEQVEARLGQPDGGYDQPQPLSMGYVERLAVADFNQDGKADVVTSDDGRTGFGLALGSATGLGAPVFTSMNSTFVTRVPVAIAVCDFDHDGKPDLAASVSYSPFIGTNTGEVRILHNTGGALAAPVTVYTGGTQGGSLVAGNFTAAGSCDLVYDDHGTLKLLTNNGAGAFTASTLLSGTPDDLRVVPFHGRGGVDDLLVTMGGTTTLYHGGFGSLTAGPAVSLGASGAIRALGIIDGDLIPDLVVSNTSTGAVSVLYGRCQ